MLAIDKIVHILNSYNIYSQKYEPTVYSNNNELGLCIDIKDSLFGYLTRIFIFNTEDELNNFLKQYFWYKEFNKKYNITLGLDSYNTKTAKIIYKYKNEELTLDNMLNMESFLNQAKHEKQAKQDKLIYIENIKELTNYLIGLRQTKDKTKQEKNKLKSKENDLKFELLQQLTEYYGREKNFDKKQIVLEEVLLSDNSLLLENLNKIEIMSVEEIKNYLNKLINDIKDEELEEKYLVNIYSNRVYTYNIDILNKQIEFVKNKINAEKNFNLKGSKIHNIDEELKSFLKANTPPSKLEIFLSNIRDFINNKYKIDDIKKAAEIIANKPIKITTINDEITEYQDATYSLKEQFNNLSKETKANLILYNSLYKSICNYIIENNYPDVTTIYNAFDFNHYYNDVEDIIFNENNNHYLLNYFSQIDFKDVTSYINSLIKICKDVESTTFNVGSSLQLFASNNIGKYKHLTPYPIPSTKYFVTSTNQLLFIPFKLEIDWDTKEINILDSFDYYTRDKIVEEKKNIILTKYKKQQTSKDDIIITTDLLLDSEITFIKGYLEGENYG